MTTIQLVTRALGIALASAVVAAPTWGQSADVRSGGDGLIYVGGYAKKIQVLDEATMGVEADIPLATGIPRSLTLSHDRSRFYVTDVTFEHLEIVDLATRSSIDSFTLSEGARKVLIRGIAVEPDERYLVVLTQSSEKLIDRFEIGEPTLLQYDLQAHEVVRALPWPDGQMRERVTMMFSPDGESLYFFSDDILVVETEGFTLTDRWELSEPIESGLGRMNIGGRNLLRGMLHEEPGFMTGLFTVTDPLNNRRLMGIARVDLPGQAVDFYTLGPAESVSFALSPDRTKAYGLHQDITRYEFWSFDLENRRLGPRQVFEGRPRMALDVSSNGELLYIYQAGETIDVYEADTYRYLRTVTLDQDMTTDLFVLPRSE